MQDGAIPSVSIPGPDLFHFLSEWVIKAFHSGPTVQEWLVSAVHILIVISIPVSLFFLIGIIYCVEKLKEVRKKEKVKHDLKIEPAFEEVKGQGNRDLTVRWAKVTSMINSQSPSDWKQAILEADTMLLDVLTGLGYQGDGVGEKLKRVQPGEFRNLDDAWEAHKVRNDIAHGRGDALDHHMAVKTIHRYRGVFQEFYYI
jgi:hypothetical protein